VKVPYISLCYALASKWIEVGIPVKVCTWELVGGFPIFYYCAITAFRLSKIKSIYFKLFFYLFSQAISQYFEGILGRLELSISV